MYNQVYGKFSTASGVWLKNKSYKNSKENIFTDEIIETYETKVLQDLMRMNLEKKIKDMSVMDVGSGRHSLALERLGAKKIDLVDISKANYVRMKKFISKNKTIIMITHKMKPLKICNKIYILKQGNVAEKLNYNDFYDKFSALYN